MITPEYMQQIVDRYLAAINAGDMDAVMELYAEDASVEDPAGTEPKRGDAILQFYTSAFAGGAKVELTGPVRLFEFDSAGKVSRMTAYFGPANMTVKDA